MVMPGKVASRLAAGLKKFKPILEAAQKKDVNESDTVIIVQDILHEVFGFDKYSEITSEHAIDGDKAKAAHKLIARASGRVLRTTRIGDEVQPCPDSESSIEPKA